MRSVNDDSAKLLVLNNCVFLHQQGTMRNQFIYCSALLAIVGLVCLPNVSPQCLTDTTNPTGYHVREFNKGQLHFTIEILLKLSQLSPYENVFVSPHSIYNTLLLAYFGSQKATKTTFEVSGH
jgi:serine protease inhibitor